MRHRQREGAPLKLPQERVLVQRGGYAPQLRQLSLHADALTVSDLDDAGELIHDLMPVMQPCDCFCRKGLPRDNQKVADLKMLL